MRRVGKEEIAQLETLAAARGLAAAFNLIYHWYWIFPVDVKAATWSGPPTWALSKNVPSRWLQIFLRGLLEHDWTTQVFLIASAITDRQAAETGQPGQLRQEMMTLVLYLAMSCPLPQIFQMGLQAFGNDRLLVMVTEHRWYLLAYLQCRLLHRYVLLPFERALKSVPTKAADASRFLLVATCWLLSSTYHFKRGEFCEGFNPDGVMFNTIAWLWAGAYLDRTDGTTHCFLNYHWLMCKSLTLYVVAWIYGKPLIAWAKGQQWLTRLGPFPMPWTALLCTLIFVFGSTEDAHRKIGYEGGCLLSLAMLMAMAQWSAGPWLRNTGLIFLGNASLGIYCFHCYFMCQLNCRDPTKSLSLPSNIICGEGLFYFSHHNRRIIPDVTSAMQILSPYGGFVQLTALATYVWAFALLIGWPLQHLFLKLFLSAERMLSNSRTLGFARG